MYSSIECCRLCKNTTLVTIMDLGEQCIASQFPIIGEVDPPKIPLVLVKCTGKDSCGLIQLQHTANPNELYGNSYGYRSGVNETMKNHLKTIIEEALQYISLEENDTILDIGSNDGTLLISLDEFTTNIHRIGMDPTGHQFQEFYPENIQLVPTYFTEASWKQTNAFPAKLVTTIAMFYDLPDPLQFTQDVKKALHPNGIWIMEQSYLPTMLQLNSFDTICHEHLEYYCLHQIEWLCNKCDLQILDVTFNESNGGSFRVVISHKGASYSVKNIHTILQKENDLIYHTKTAFEIFIKKCLLQKTRLQIFLRDMVSQGKKVCLYGASTKGNTLLQYYEIDNTIVSCAAERNPIKYGRHTPYTHIPIVSEAEVRLLQPDFMFVLPWHFKSEFLEREKEYLEEKGQFIFPLPQVNVISHYKKALITGITGQIGSYMKKILLEKGYIVYGTVREIPKTSEKNVFYLSADLLDKTSLEDIIYTIHPDEIYHFAAISDSFVANHSHINKTLDINSIPVKHFLQILKEYVDTFQRKIPFFQSSSVEIWKGSKETYYTDTSTHLFPTTPYGISKASAYWLCKYYKDKYKLPIYQGILSSIESPLRKDHFILKKVVNYIHSYLEEPTLPPLLLGDVDIYRDWVHARDAVEAIYTLVHSGIPSEYLISTGEQVSLKYAIQQAFFYVGIVGEWIDDIFIQNNTENGFKKVFIISSSNDHIEEVKTKKIYNPIKLRELGWKPSYDIDSILKELLHLKSKDYI